MADSTPKSYSTDPTLWLYTSLTAGSSQIITATSRLEGILKANKIPFQALDVATDEKARMLWGRRAGKRKLPGLVRQGMIIGDFSEVEEWNEFGEIKQNIPPLPGTSTPSASTTNTPSKGPSAINPSASSFSTPPPKQASSSSSANANTPLNLAMRQAGIEAAKKASEPKSIASPVRSSTPLGSSDLDKLENSAPTGLPPPSGTTSAADAIAPSTGGSNVESKADAVPATSDAEGDLLSLDDDVPQSQPASTGSAPLTTSATPVAVTDILSSSSALDSSSSLQASLQTPLSPTQTKHRGSTVSEAPEEVIKAVESERAIPEEPEEEEDAESKTAATLDKGIVGTVPVASQNEGAAASRIESANVKTEEAQAVKELENEGTQRQGAANADKAGESVGD